MRNRNVRCLIGWGLALLALASSPALAKTAASCAGAALLSGAQLICSHVDPQAPEQFCNYEWALATAANQTQVIQGSFLLPPGASNVQVYTGYGFVRAMSPPIVLCQGRKGRS